MNPNYFCVRIQLLICHFCKEFPISFVFSILGENLVPKPPLQVQEDAEGPAAAQPAADPRQHAEHAAAEPGLHPAHPARVPRRALPALGRRHPARTGPAAGHAERGRQPPGHEPAHLLVGHGVVQSRGYERHELVYAPVLVVPPNGPLYEPADSHLGFKTDKMGLLLD